LNSCGGIIHRACLAAEQLFYDGCFVRAGDEEDDFLPGVQHRQRQRQPIGIHFINIYRRNEMLFIVQRGASRKKRRRVAVFAQAEQD